MKARKDVMVVKKRTILLFCIVAFISGCETFKGAGQGFKKDVENVSSKQGWVWKTDQWMQDHMW